MILQTFKWASFFHSFFLFCFVAFLFCFFRQSEIFPTAFSAATLWLQRCPPAISNRPRFTGLQMSFWSFMEHFCGLASIDMACLNSISDRLWPRTRPTWNYTSLTEGGGIQSCVHWNRSVYMHLHTLSCCLLCGQTCMYTEKMEKASFSLNHWQLPGSLSELMAVDDPLDNFPPSTSNPIHISFSRLLELLLFFCCANLTVHGRAVHCFSLKDTLVSHQIPLALFSSSWATTCWPSVLLSIFNYHQSPRTQSCSILNSFILFLYLFFILIHSCIHSFFFNCLTSPLLFLLSFSNSLYSFLSHCVYWLLPVSADYIRCDLLL